MRLTRIKARKDSGAIGKYEAIVKVASNKKQRNSKEKKKNSKKVIQGVWSPLFIRDKTLRIPKDMLLGSSTPRGNASPDSSLIESDPLQYPQVTRVSRPLKKFEEAF